MLKPIEEFGKFVVISGFRRVEIRNAKAFLNSLLRCIPNDVEIQLFNADLVATWRHLYFAALNALTAFKTGRNISKSIPVETALYATAQRQIKKALNLIGVNPETENIAVILMCSKAASAEEGFCAIIKYLKIEPDETVLSLSEKKIKEICSTYDISKTALKTISSKDNFEIALIDLVIEKMALLSTQL